MVSAQENRRRRLCFQQDVERVGLFQAAVSQDCGVNGPGPIVSVLEALWFPAAGQQTQTQKATSFSLCSAQAICRHQEGNLKFSRFGKEIFLMVKDLGWKCEFGAVILSDL